MPRVLLILPSATYRAPDFLDAARRLGVEVLVASEHRQALDNGLVISLRDPERAADVIVRAAPFDAVVAVDDQGARAAAHASQRLGLRGNTPEAAARARDKAAMRAALAAAGVPQPRYRVDELDSIGFPCVLKPLSLSGSRGVIRADTPAEAAEAAERIHRIVPGEPLLVEEFVGGPEVAVEGLLEDGRLRVLAIFDKPDPLEGPYFEETVYVTPSRLPGLDRVEAATAAAADALGLTDGPIHAELRVGDEPKVIEVAARSIGGLCSRILRFGLGVSLEELILRHALGMDVDGMRRERTAAGVMMLPIPRSGTLVEVAGLDDARAVPGIAGVEITIPRGHHVEALPEGDRYLGFVFAKAERPEQVEAALRGAQERLGVRVE
jgi:biotin carboxylase